MLNRSTDDEMARITERGCQHAAAAWLRVANHAVLAEDQLHARQQVWQHHYIGFFKLHWLLRQHMHSQTDNCNVSDALSFGCHTHHHLPGCRPQFEPEPRHNGRLHTLCAG